MATSLREGPENRTFDFYARLNGLGRNTVRLVTVSNVVLGLTAAATAGWAIHATHAAADRVQRYVVVLDAESNVIATAQAKAGGQWSPSNGNLIDFAQMWVRFLRSRPLHEPTLIFQRTEVRRATDRRIFYQLGEGMREADEKLGRAEVSISSISANVLNRTEDTATLLVIWTEEVKPGSDKPVTLTATLDVRHQEPTKDNELRQNPRGLFVTSFQPTREQQQ